VLLRIDSTSLVRCRKLGVAGSVLVVFGGVFAGVPPLRDPVLQVRFLQQLRTLTTPSVMCVFVGISMLLLAWWRLGRLVRERNAPSLAELFKTMLWWSAPLLITMPIFSRTSTATWPRAR